MAHSGGFLAIQGSHAQFGHPWLILEYSWPFWAIQYSPCSFRAPHDHSGLPMLIQGSPCSFWLSLAHSGGFLDILGNSGLPMLILGLLGIFFAIKCSPCSFWSILGHYSCSFLASLAIQGSPCLILEYSWSVLLMFIQCTSCSFSAPHAHYGHPWLILGYSWIF